MLYLECDGYGSVGVERRQNAGFTNATDNTF